MTDLMLSPHASLKKPKGPLLIVVLDGVGLGVGDDYDAVARAEMPRLRACMAAPGRFMKLKAHGLAVGLPSDEDMGNSEVGHNALGSGRIVQQGAALVDAALATGAMFKGAGWQKLAGQWHKGGTLHLIGLLSDGGVHSRLDQIFGIVDGAAARGCKRIRIHALFDGRDVPDGSSVKYLVLVAEKAASLHKLGVDLRVASGGGRMFVTMDRYESDWSIVERGWKAHVLGDAPAFASAEEAIAAARHADAKMSDQHLPPFVVVDRETKTPIGTIEDGDAVVFCNFRGDRAIQMSRAFEEKEFTPFDRKRVPYVVYAGLMEYDGDLHIPSNYLVEPPTIERTSGEYLAQAGLRTFACSETQKYGHVTYFWNGNRSGKFSDVKETYLEVPSNLPPFELKPAMKAMEVADAAVTALSSGDYDVVRVNLANGDMVGHTGDLAATIASCAAADRALGLMLDAVVAAGGVFIVTADHGNADDMALRDKKGAPLRDAGGKVLPRTSHTLAPVPLCIGGPGLDARVGLRGDLQTPGLANIAATVMNLLGFEAPKDYEPSLLRIE
ncbi:MAG: 2,3-bisphosphoglycerate-independent phosphoglycerate mutase [Deltaproteobacteria bacterium]|nr:2,3-bisphosphoglycerate-independent phosphoglycerate mutase [Deltaproteobacteria bacterium]